jgi:hypothetical protein
MVYGNILIGNKGNISRGEREFEWSFFFFFEFLSNIVE